MDGVDDWPLFDTDINWDAAQDALVQAGLSDGLPLVIPTRERLAAMLAGMADPERSHGQMPPLFRELTGVAVAYNCVLAGCSPGALPVVLTASIACLDPGFNLLGLATTTGSPAVATIVHGPVIEKLEMNDGGNCLAPGNRANATLGRAVSLVMRNIAGMSPGIADMATMGQPGKYGFCFPETRTSHLPLYHARHGLDANDSAVTVLGVSGTAEVLPSAEAGNWSTPEDILRPVALMMQAAIVAGGGARKPEPNGQLLLLPPELADLMVLRGWTFDRIENQLCAGIQAVSGGSTEISPSNIHILVTGGPGVKMTVIPLWGGGTLPITRALLAA